MLLLACASLIHYPNKNKLINKVFLFSFPPRGFFLLFWLTQLHEHLKWLWVAGGNAQPEMQRGGKKIGVRRCGGDTLPGGAICLRHPTSSHPQVDPMRLAVPAGGGLSLLCPASPGILGTGTNCGDGAILHHFSSVSCTVLAGGPIAPTVQNGPACGPKSLFSCPSFSRPSFLGRGAGYGLITGIDNRLQDVQRHPHLKRQSTELKRDSSLL